MGFKFNPLSGNFDMVGSSGSSSSPTTTQGDMIYRGASADTRLAIGQAYQYLRSNGSTPEWMDSVNRGECGYIEDFHEPGATSTHGVWVNSGASVSYFDSAASLPSALHPGIWKATVTNAGNYGILLGTSLMGGSFNFGSGVVLFECMIMLSALSDATDTTILRVGFGVANGGDYKADFTDGAYFYYTHSNNSGKWSARTANNSTWTQLDSNIPVAANTWYRLTVVANAGGTSIEFFVDGVSIGTITTNIPTTYPRLTQPAIQWQKTAGTAARYYILDYYAFYKRTTR